MMPAIFIGHGNPMNAIADNAFTQMLSKLGKKIPKPKAIVCVSAHWLTEGTWVTGMQSPRTIHDFYGFPQALFDVQYPAQGSPEVANLICETVMDPKIQIDQEIWGIDHGTWSVLRHMYPKADIPVVQLSINHTQPFEFHFELGKKLQALRNQEILIIGSGNIVHNLRSIRWEENAKPFDWAVEFDEWIKSKLMERNFSPLIAEATKNESGKLSIPTTDHYIPFLYTLGASTQKDQLQFEYEGIENGSISMRCMSFGA